MLLISFQCNGQSATQCILIVFFYCSCTYVTGKQAELIFAIGLERSKVKT